ncbi:MAG: YciI family protein [Sphingopyxis sp.]|nr:YciI family protein [Sphingopyxis sp.]
MYFVIYALDRPDAGDLREKTRPAHREYLHGSDLPVRLRLAGPLLADDGATMIGSLIIVEADDSASVEAFSAADPYRLAGLVGSVTIRPWNWTTGNRDAEAIS